MTSTTATHRPGPVGWPIQTTQLVLPVGDGRPGPVGWFGSQDSGASQSDDGDSSEDDNDLSGRGARGSAWPGVR